MRRAAFLFCLLLSPHTALAGAWTREEGSVQQISGLLVSQADHSFGSAAPISFLKGVAQTHTEYGVRDWLTLIAASESAYVEITQPGLAPYTAFNQGIEGGARLRLRGGTWGVLSAEASYRSAGAFNFAVSANPSAPGNGVRCGYSMGAAPGWMVATPFWISPPGGIFFPAPVPMRPRWTSPPGFGSHHATW